MFSSAKRLTTSFGAKRVREALNASRFRRLFSAEAGEVSGREVASNAAGVAVFGSIVSEAFA
jgi:hypothetical protein